MSLIKGYMDRYEWPVNKYDCLNVGKDIKFYLTDEISSLKWPFPNFVLRYPNGKATETYKLQFPLVPNKCFVPVQRHRLS